MFKVHTEGDYCKRILEKLWQQCESEDFCDVVLKAGPNGKRIPAHRLILSVSSEYFRGMFSSSILESPKNEIELPCVDGDALQSLVEYCYKGRVVISEDIVVEMLKTADMLFLGNVVIACANFLEDLLHPSNCLGFTLLSEQYRCETLLQKAKDYSLINFMDACKTDEFLSLNTEQLSELLASDDLYVSAEEEVFQSVLQWIGHDPDEREKCKEELLRLVRMPLLERSFLVGHVKPICTSAECFQIYVEAIESQLLLDQKKVTHRNSITRGDEFLLAITKNHELGEMNIHYYCPQQFKWMKWSKRLDYHNEFDVAVMGEQLYIFEICGNQTNIEMCLNLRTMTSHQLSPMMEYRRFFRAIELNEFIYVIGGFGKSSCEKWNSKTNSWSNIAAMSNERYSFVAMIANGKIYVLGGFDKNDIELNTVECFDPDKNVWTNVATMPTARYGFGIAILNEKMYVVGGRFKNKILNTAEYFDPDKNMWTAIACMNCHRIFPKVAVLNGLLYVAGGVDGERTVECYNAKANHWTMIRIFNEDGFIDHHDECFVFRNKFVVCCKGRFEEYDPKTNEWLAAPTFNSIKTENVEKIFSYSGKLLRAYAK